MLLLIVNIIAKYGAQVSFFTKHVNLARESIISIPVRHHMHAEIILFLKKFFRIKVIIYFPFTGPEMQRHWATSFLLPVGSIFILGMVILLMVMISHSLYDFMIKNNSFLLKLNA